MKTHEIRFNSQASLRNQVEEFKKEHPFAKYDEAEIQRAETLAGKMDNEIKRARDTSVLRIAYSEELNLMRRTA